MHTAKLMQHLSQLRFNLPPLGSLKFAELVKEIKSERQPTTRCTADQLDDLIVQLSRLHTAVAIVELAEAAE